MSEAFRLAFYNELHFSTVSAVTTAHTVFTALVRHGTLKGVSDHCCVAVMAFPLWIIRASLSSPFFSVCGSSLDDPSHYLLRMTLAMAARGLPRARRDRVCALTPSSRRPGDTVERQNCDDGFICFVHFDNSPVDVGNVKSLLLPDSRG